MQTLGVLTSVRDIANDDIVCTWSNIMRMRSDKMATTGISDLYCPLSRSYRL